MKRVFRRHASTKMKNVDQKILIPAEDTPQRSVNGEECSSRTSDALAVARAKCFSATYFLRMFTGRTAASHNARCGQELSQRLFASVCDHKTLSGSVLP